MKKKETPKKAPKKAPVKLIEGKYSHKFLTRLAPHEGERLAQIMKSENIKSFTAAVTLAVMEYASMKNEIKDLRTEVNELEARNGEIVETVSDYIQVSKRLNSLKV